jgi:AmmeMemoRadiSam system protein A
MGRVEPSDSLVDAVAQSAINAALCDPRFAPVVPDEVPDLEIEISVLSELSPIAAEAIEAGKHGVLVVRDSRRALLLPQVAEERRWSADRFLSETCLKAGLTSQAWREPETRLFGFTVEVFSESEFPAHYSSSV